MGLSCEHMYLHAALACKTLLCDGLVSLGTGWSCCGQARFSHCIKCRGRHFWGEAAVVEQTGCLLHARQSCLGFLLFLVLMTIMRIAEDRMAWSVVRYGMRTPLPISVLKLFGCVAFP